VTTRRDREPTLDEDAFASTSEESFEFGLPGGPSNEETTRSQEG
jgi:hypothetical protein